MGNKTKVIPSKAREILESVTNEFGIEVIEDYIKIYKKRQRKRMNKNNTKEKIAYEVYDLIYREGYSRVRAIEKIAMEKNISEHTVNNHLNNFNQEAKKNNFYTLSWIVDKIYDSCNYNSICLENSINSLAKENNLERDILDTYYWRYKTLPKKEKAKYELNFNSINIPDDFFHNRTLENNLISKINFNQELSNENTQIDDSDIPF